MADELMLDLPNNTAFDMFGGGPYAINGYVGPVNVVPPQVTREIGPNPLPNNNATSSLIDFLGKSFGQFATAGTAYAQAKLFGTPNQYRSDQVERSANSTAPLGSAANPGTFGLGSWGILGIVIGGVLAALVVGKLIK